MSPTSLIPWLAAMFLLFAPTATASGFPMAAPPSTAVAAEPLDINTASLPALQALPGMGAVYARRVVEGRPYTAKNQLLTRGVLPAAAYEAIRDWIVAHRLARVP